MKYIIYVPFSDHPPEMQKDILNAILNSDVGCGASAATAPSGETVATTMAQPPPIVAAQPPPIVEAQPISLAMEPVAAAAEKEPEAVKADEGGKAAAEGEGTFPPITVSEFGSGRSSSSAADGAQTPAEDLTTS